MPGFSKLRCDSFSLSAIDVCWVQIKNKKGELHHGKIIKYYGTYFGESNVFFGCGRGRVGEHKGYLPTPNT
jgi:hypothetical protein